ncbi:MAG: hypothetical protein PUC32_05840 [Oscillospiraceae bacterium]|nr:hypothetical protein [Oscillospiraceae bacterium]
MGFPQSRDWKKLNQQSQKKMEAQRVNLLLVDANPNPDFRLPHNLLLQRQAKKK